MNPAFLFLTLCAALQACKMNDLIKSQPKIASSKVQECPELPGFIRNNWKIHQKSGLFKYGTDFIPKLRDHFGDCLSTLNRQDAIDLFGVPQDTSIKGYLIYYLNDVCLSKSVGVCHYCSIIYEVPSERILTIREGETLTIK